MHPFQLSPGVWVLHDELGNEIEGEGPFASEGEAWAAIELLKHRGPRPRM